MTSPAARPETTPLARLSAAYWEGRLRADPVLATQIGVRRYDHLMDDVSPAAVAAERSRLAALEREAREIDADGLAGEDRLTLTALLTQLRSDIDVIDAGLDDWLVDPLEGVPVGLLDIEAYQPIEDPEDGLAMAARWRAIGPYVDQRIANLGDALGRGLIPVRDPVERVVDELDGLAASRDDEWAFLAPLEVERDAWTPTQRATLDRDLRAAVAGSIRPAFERYRRFLVEDVLPIARPSELPGIVHVPGGDEAYARQVRVHTSLDVAPEELHRTGMAELERINAQMTELGRRVLGTATLTDAQGRLRSDPALYFANREELAGKALISLTRAKAAIAHWFGVLPRADCVVVPMGEHEEKHSTIAYYRDPDPTGRRPGQFFINTSEPATRPRYEAESLAFHESIPGHHLQIAIAQEIPGLPEFRRHLGVTAFWEGWGLYAERLADEMGLYTSDLDRLGMLSADAWRASRLVVDTGMHALGWTRRRAIDFLMANSALAENNVVNEVDRYIVWPGQALAYKTGQLELLRVRRRAETALGDRFDIRAFHDAILAHGAVPLAALETIVDDHIGHGRGADARR